MACRVEVDSDLCISSGMCVAEVPGLFRFGDDETAEVIPGRTRLSDEELLDLARGCPSAGSPRSPST